MSPKELIDDHVSLAQCKKAVEALHKHATEREAIRQEKELLSGKEQNVWLNVTVKKVDATQKYKPVRIPVKYPLVDPRTSGVCLIVKDPQREYKDLIESHGIKFITRVVGVAKLKGKFKPYEARRALLKENALFLVDDRVVEMMPKLLGVKWFEAKKQPIPVSLKRKDLKAELERAISSTYMNQNKGTCTSIKVANLSHTPAQILTNLQLALPVIATHVRGNWENIQSLHIKTNASVSLPIWNCDLNDRWEGLVAGKEAAEDDEMQVDDTPVKPKASKKRSTEEDEEPAKPRKKVKGAEGVVATKVDEPKANPPAEAKKVETKKSKSKDKAAQPKADKPEPASEEQAEPVLSSSADSSAARKPRKRKQQKATEAEPPTVEAIAVAIETPAETVVSDGPKKRKKAARATAEELMEVEDPPAPAPAPAPAEPTAEPAAKKKREKKKKTADATKLSSEEVTIETALVEAEVVPSPVTAEVKETKKSKKPKKSASEETETPAPETKKAKKVKIVEPEAPVAESSKSSEEKVTKKAKAGDKKKDKVTAKSKKTSAKDALLGKKAGQEL